MNWKEILANFTIKLEPLYTKSECRLLFFMLTEHFWEMDKLALTLDANIEITLLQQQQISDSTRFLLENKPIQYIIGKAWFYDLELLVNENTLIPRPETEELVEWIIETVGNDFKGSILDIGTGSGCIPLALANQLKPAHVWATDVSEKALAVAKNNNEKLGLSVHFLKHDILHNKDWNENKLDVIVSNPPYITQNEKSLMQPNVLDYEPHLALFVEQDDVLQFYREIAGFAKMHLKEKGSLFFELNEFSASAVIEMLEKKGFLEITVKKDISGKERMLRCIY